METVVREYEHRISAVEQSIKSAHHRINDIEKLVESVHTIANEIKHMREDLNDVKERVDIIEEKPAKRWDLVVTTVVTALVSGLFGMLLSNLIGG
nr:MAG TPA: Hemolysin [Caudoviricetes sp.]DAZ34685.1 MAG TPA: hemolysin [Caudoviricetes sp.]